MKSQSSAMLMSFMLNTPQNASMKLFRMHGDPAFTILTRCVRMSALRLSPTSEVH